MKTSPRPAQRHVFWRFCLGLLLVHVARAADTPIYVTMVAPTERTAIFNAYSAGSTVALEIQSRPLPSGALQWLHDDQPIPGATAPKLTLPNLSTADAGNYRLRATDGASVCFSDTITINVLVGVPSVVDTHFTSQLPASFRVSNVTAFAADGSFIVISSDSSTSPVRLAADGRLVPGFNYPLSAGTILAGFPDGRLITSQSPYLLAADGSPAAFALPAGFDPTKPLSSAAVTADGRSYLSQKNVIVGLLSNGTINPGFSFSDTADQNVTILGIDRLGRLLIRGERADPDSSHYPSIWDTIYRIGLDGNFERSFSTVGHMKGDYGRGLPLVDGRVLTWSAYEGFYVWRMFNEDGSEVPNYKGNFYGDTGVFVDPRGFVYATSYGDRLRRSRIGLTSIEPDPDFFGGLATAYTLSNFTSDPSGKLLFFTNTAAWEGHATQNLSRARTDVPLPFLPPQLTVLRSSYLPTRGSTFTLTAQASGDGPYTYQWLALDGQPLPASTSSSELVISNLSAKNFGRYQLRVNGIFGSELSGVVEVGVSSSSVPYLANLSGRAMTGTGEDTVIAGLAIKINAGALGMPALLRGAGPALGSLGVTNALPNPAINLYDAAGHLAKNNDQWSVDSSIAPIAAAVGAFPFANGSDDAALLQTFPTSNSTVQLASQDGRNGVGLLEIYRVPDDRVPGDLLNLSFRARTASGDGTAIAGFVIVDPQNFDRPARVLLRAVGPTLAQSGIQHPLANPILTVYDSTGKVVAQNDDWPSHLTAEFTAYDAATQQVGAFPLPYGSKDSGLLLDLPAGAYSMQATGGTGVVLMEVYLVR